MPLSAAVLTSVVCSTVPLPSGFTFTRVVLLRHAVSVTVASSTAKIRMQRIQVFLRQVDQ